MLSKDKFTHSMVTDKIKEVRAECKDRIAANGLDVCILENRNAIKKEDEILNKTYNRGKEDKTDFKTSELPAMIAEDGFDIEKKGLDIFIRSGRGVNPNIRNEDKTTSLGCAISNL